MKKSLFIISFILVIVLALTACSKQNSTQDTNNSPSESLTMLDEGVWPEMNIPKVFLFLLEL